MKKAYFLAPVLGLILFIAFYLNHRSGLAEREAAQEAARTAALQARTESELAARREAMASAIAAAEQRKKERDAKAAKDALDQEARQKALDARDQAFRDQDRLAKQLERLEKELAEEKAALERLRSAATVAQAEKTFLTDFVTKAQANVDALQALLTRLAQPIPAAAAPASR